MRAAVTGAPLLGALSCCVAVRAVVCASPSVLGEHAAVRPATQTAHYPTNQPALLLPCPTLCSLPAAAHGAARPRRNGAVHQGGVPQACMDARCLLEGAAVLPACPEHACCHPCWLDCRNKLASPLGAGLEAQLHGYVLPHWFVGGCCPKISCLLCFILHNRMQLEPQSFRPTGDHA